MSGDVLALVVEDTGSPNGYLVIDSRDGKPVSWHGDLGDANGVAAYLNAGYPDGHAPARDTLIYELLRHRHGEGDLCIETWWLIEGRSIECPTHVPTGPGWDHIHKAVKR